MEELNAHLSSVKLREEEEAAAAVAVQQVELNAASTNPPSPPAHSRRPVKNTSGNDPESASSEVATLALVIKYLNDYWAHSQAARALVAEMRKQGGGALEAFDGPASSSSLPDLHVLVAAATGERHVVGGEKIAVNAEQAAAESLPLDLPSLVGPPTIPHAITHAHSALHTNNILTVRSVLLPCRKFITSPSELRGRDPHFSTTLRRVIVSTSSDKQVLFFDPEDGEVLESLDPVQRVLDIGHTSPVLDVAQQPNDAREFVTVGMDGKLCLWDLLKRKVVCERKDHSRFIVKCAWSPDGQWLVTAGYDKKVVIYRRRATESTTRMDMDGGQDEEEDDIEVADLATRLEPIYKLDTRSNPEAIHFVTNPSDQTTWLIYSLRDDCFVHYICIDDLQSTSGPAPRQQSFNTNENPFDTHRSYSILSIASHPTHPSLLSLLTGAHSSTSSTSQLLLLPLFSDRRRGTIHTGVPTSEHFSPRQAWLRDGSGVYITSEEGFLRLYDTQGKERCLIGVHGVAAADNGEGGSTMSAEEKAKRWRMGGMNGSIRDINLLDDATVITCGFDRTVRVVQRLI